VAGAASPGELTAGPRCPPAHSARSDAPAPSRARDACRLAEPRDEPAIARLLRESPFDGAIRLSFECEPDALAATAIYGSVRQTIVAERAGRIVAMATRSERDVFVNGVARRIGYLCQFRVARGVMPGRGLLERGFEFCRTLHEDGGVPAYLVSIVEDNRPARRLLTSGRIRGAPVMVPVAPFVTFAIPAYRTAASRGVPSRIERGRPDLAGEIAACLHRCGRRHQFAPVWTAEDLGSPLRTPGLRIEDFLVLRENGRVTACVARWDQRAYRQTVARGYAPWLSRVRSVANLAARAGWTPHLPAPGASLPFAYLSHVAFEGDADGLMVLIERALAEARKDGLDFLVLGAAAHGSLAHAVAARFRHRRYVSRLNLAHWSDGEAFAGQLDDRIAAPELAVL